MSTVAGSDTHPHTQATKRFSYRVDRLHHVKTITIIHNYLITKLFFLVDNAAQDFFQFHLTDHNFNYGHRGIALTHTCAVVEVEL